MESANVVAGEVTIEQTGTLTTITASDGSIIEAERLNVLSDETLEFLQPHELARVLARVMGVDPTTIDGNLLANGVVYIVNPSGVFFGGSAVVNVGRLVAGAGEISDADFRAGIDRFTGLEGAVENAGTIQAGAVSLVGRSVANHGRIVAPDGMIAMVAGGEVFLGSLDGRVLIQIDGPTQDPGHWGVENTGTLDAGGGEVVLSAGDVYSLAANHTGITRGSHIRIAGGEGGLVQVAGALDASDTNRGGSVVVTGDRVAVLGADIDASGNAGGGEILIGGDVRGEGDLPTATRTYVSQDSSLRADALDTGDGGKVVVWSDEATWSYGEIQARGGENGGNGGFAEISGAALDSRSRVDLGASAGEAGTLLYDPLKIEITGSADGSGPGAGTPLADSDVLFDTEPVDGTFVVFESELESTDANITLQADQSVRTVGEFGDSDASGTADVLLMPDRSLTISTANATQGEGFNGIDLTSSNQGASLEFRSQGGAIQLESATAIEGVGDGISTEVDFGEITTGGGSAIVTNAAGSVSGVSVDTTGPGDAGSITIVAQGHDADPDAGTERVEGNVTVSESLIARGAAAPGANEDGGGGGSVQVFAVDGSIQIGPGGGPAGTAVIDTSGGDGDLAGGFAGFVVLDAEGIAPLGAIDQGDPSNPVQPGRDLLRGDVTVNGSVLARGGAGDSEDGGDGGFTQLASRVGSVTVTGSIDASGGDGQMDGGDAAAVSVSAQGVAATAPETIDVLNADGELVEQTTEGTAAAPGNVTVAGGIVSTGGAGTDGVAGDGGGLDQVVRDIVISTQVGSANVGAIDISGGHGKTGGSAGRLLATTAGAEDPTPDDPGDGLDAVSGDLTIGMIAAIGGNASGPHSGDPEGTPLFRAGAGGTIGVQSLDGTTAVAGVDTSGGDGERGGAGGTVVIESRGAGDVGVGAIVSRGGDGVAGTCTDCGDRSERGGDGGTVGITAWDDGSASVTSIVADGGQGADADGDGGDISVAASGEESGVGDVTVQGTLSARGGASDESEAEDGLVFLRAIGSVLGNVGVAGDLAVDATRMGTGVNDRLEITAAGGADLADHTLFLFNDGDAAVGLEADTFGTLDVTQRTASADIDVALDELGANPGWVRAEKQQTGISVGEDGATPIFGKSRVSADTNSQPIDLVFRLEDTSQGESEPAAELEIGSLLLGGNTELASLDDVIVPAGSIDVPNDSTLILRADSDRDGVGDLVAGSDGVQIATAGNVTLEGITIGADRVFQIQRAPGSAATDRILRLIGNGDMDVAVTDPLFATIAVDQFNTDGSIYVTQDSDVIHVGPAVDDVISDVQIDTLATQAGVVLRIEDRRTDDETDPGRELVLPSQGVFLGGDSSFSNPGDITLGDGEGVAVTVREGATLGLESENGAIRNGVTGADRTAISMSADGTGAGGLVLEAGISVGSAGAPIEVQGIGDLAGAAEQGSFLVTNHLNGTPRVTEIRHPELGRTVVRGINATERVELVDAGSNTIVLAGDFEANDIEAGTGILLDGAVVVEEDASVATVGGGVRFTSTVDADADVGDGAESLRVSAQGPIEWAGQIGSQHALGDLVSNGTTTTLEPDTSSVRTTGSQTFGGKLEGGNVELEAGGKVTFGGDIGAESPLVRLEVRTPDAVEFTGAESVRAEQAILLKPDGTAVVVAEAGIYKLDGDLAFETSEFRIGEREKFSVGGNLEIQADDRATFGDISAEGLRVEAPTIELLAREAGPAYTTSGERITDNGLDILGNQLVFSSTPVVIDIDPTTDSPVVTLASQSGTVIAPDLSGFDVRLIDQQGGGVSTSNLQVVEDPNAEPPSTVVVDLVATGDRAVGDSARVLPPNQPMVDAWVGPSFGSDAPALSTAAPPADDVLAYLQCSYLGSGAEPEFSRCLAPVAAGESDVPTFDYRALQTQRARDAALLYRELMGSSAETQSERAAFDDAVNAFRRDRGSDDVDGAALYQFMEGSGHADAVRYVDRLAHLMTQLQLLDLAPAEAQRLRENLAQEFAQALEPSGLEADTLLDVIDASRVGLPR